MLATLKEFFEENPNCKKFINSKEFQYIFNEILSKEENIIAMIDANESGKPALYACVFQVEKYYNSLSNPSIDLNDNFTRQAIGRAVKTILRPFGYEVKGQRDFPTNSQNPKPKYITSGTLYELKGNATMAIKKAIVELKNVN